MRSAVASAFVDFSEPFEGRVAHMYLDRLGWVTTAVGVKIDDSDATRREPEAPALALPWVHRDGTPASRDEIRSEWLMVKRNPVAAVKGYTCLEGLCSLSLTREGLQLVVERKLVDMDARLAARFPEYEAWPADAQLATLSLAWACGSSFDYPKLDAALRVRDFETAALECLITRPNHRVIRARNAANVLLYANASHVQSYHLDPDVLVWPGALAERADESNEEDT